jgi:hypothetical protein
MSTRTRRPKQTDAEHWTLRLCENDRWIATQIDHLLAAFDQGEIELDALRRRCRSFVKHDVSRQGFPHFKAWLAGEGLL